MRRFLALLFVLLSSTFAQAQNSQAFAPRDVGDRTSVIFSVPTGVKQITIQCFGPAGNLVPDSALGALYGGGGFAPILRWRGSYRFVLGDFI